MKKLIIALFCMTALFAQAQVTGKVTDEKGNALKEAVIRLYKNNQLAKTIFTDTAGYFNFNAPGLDRIIISSIGYVADTIYTEQRALGTIRLQIAARQLKEVQIQANQPIIRQETDRSIIRVNDQVKKLANNGLEIINLAPGITVSDDENSIAMSGKSEVQIMINDKVVKMTARDLAKMLKAMPAGSIKQVELLTNPSSKYEVNGNTGIINIKTNTVTKGLIGNIDYSTSQSTNNWTDLSGLLNYGVGNLAVSAYGAYHSGGYLTKSVKLRELNTGQLYQQSSSLSKWSDPVFRLSADYGINSNHTIGAIIEREVSTNKANYNTFSEQAVNRYLTTGSSPSVRHWNIYNLNYRYSDTVGTEFIVDVDRADFINSGQTVVNTTAQAQFNYEKLTTIKINTLKADYTHTYANKLKLEAGLKVGDVKTENSQNGISFQYNENIKAVYGSVSGSLKRLGWQLGIRAEQTNAMGERELVNNLKAMQPDTNYLNLLPSLYLTYAPGAKHHLRLSISRRITRPDYSDLEPFTYVEDPLYQRIGNPSLRVQRNEQAELTYTFNDRITLIGSYNLASDYFSSVLKQSGNLLIEMPGNAGKMKTFNLDLNYPIKINKWWNMLYKVNLGNDYFKGALFQGQLDEGKWRYQFSSSQRFNLYRNYLFQLSGRYTSASQNLIYRAQSSANVSASISRKLFKDQGSIRIGISDIFKTQRNYTSVNFGNLNYIDRATFESQRVSLNFSWRFGNSKIKQTADRNGGNADEKGRSGG